MDLEILCSNCNDENARERMFPIVMKLKIKRQCRAIEYATTFPTKRLFQLWDGKPFQH